MVKELADFRGWSIVQGIVEVNRIFGEGSSAGKLCNYGRTDLT